MEKKHLVLNISELKENPKNPKKHDDELIKKSIKELGFVDDIIVDENNVILAGHGRLKALKELDYKEIDVIKIIGWTDQEKEKFLLLSNKSVENGGYDEELLKGFDEDILDFAGFDTESIFPIEPDEKDDEVPETPEEPKSKLGDIYQLGNHRIMCGDSTKIEDVEKLMDGKKADMVFTDPPYGNNLGYGRGQLGERFIKSDENTDVVINVIKVANEYLLNNSHFLLFTQWRTYAEIETEMKLQGIKIRSVIVWDKKNAGLSGGGLAEQHEWLIVGIKGKAKQRFYSGNVW